MTVKCLLYEEYLKYLIAHTTSSNSISFTEYFSSKEFRKRDAYATATQPSGECCSNAAPSPVIDASQTMRASNCWSKSSFCVMSATSFNIFLNAMLCSDDRLSGYLTVF